MGWVIFRASWISRLKRAICGVRGDLRADRLQGDVLVEDEILGFVDLPHAALADEANDPEPVGQHIARREGVTPPLSAGRTASPIAVMVASPGAVVADCGS